MARNWTDEQRQAFETRDRTLLVSAAAGSGKTAVLTERVIRSLTEGEHPLDITRLLVVTFTHAAAKELKERIGRALSEAIKETPDSPHLARQLRLLPAAQISTIHSFCLGLLRKYANQLGLRPGVRVADQSETDPLANELMQEVVRDAYASLIDEVSNQDLRGLIEDLDLTRKNAKLVELLVTLHKNASTTREGVHVVRTYADAYLAESKGEVMDSRWGKQLADLLHNLTTTFLSRLDILWHKDLALDEKRFDKAKDAYNYFVSFADGILQRLSTYTALQAHILSFEMPALPANSSKFHLSDEANAVNNLMRAFAEAFKNIKKENLRKRYFTLSEDAWHAHFAHAHQRVNTIAALLAEFDSRYRKELARRGAVDFGLMERYAFELLYKDGEPTPICEEVKGAYDAVYVDEYQDVSPLQHALFEVVGGDHRFMVGDIKQSIYRFRHAEPEIFASLKRSMSSLDPQAEQREAGIFMSKNFRCDKTVVDFVNDIFDFLFGEAGERIAYVPADRLTYAKDEGGMALQFPVEVAVFSPPGKSPTPEEILESDDEGDLEQEEDPVFDEPLWVAKQIHDLLTNGTLRDGVTPLRPKDIAILLRSVREDKIAPFVAALASWGIPVACKEQTDFFLNPEVQLALCLLNTIDNPRRDIYLAGALCSPLYGFSADELLCIRQEGAPTDCLYEALVSYCERHPAFEKGSSFLGELARLRAIAEGIPVFRLIDRLYRETPLLAIAGKEQVGGENTLKLLYNYARTCEGVSFAGLYGFLRFIDSQIAAKRTFNAPKMGVTPDAVQIISMHSSKGLEFPVVFVSRLGGQFNKNDVNGDLIQDNELGIAMKRMHKDGHARIDSPMRLLAAQHISDLQAEEEMRLLYVALTRARERLYVTGTVPSTTAKTGTAFDHAIQAARDVAAFPDRASLLSQKSLLSFVLVSLIAKGETIFPTTCDERGSYTASDEQIELDEAAVARYVALLRERFAYTYPREHLTHLPRKLAVSRLSPTLLDERESEAAAEGAPLDLADLLAESKQKFTKKALRLPKILDGEREAAANEKGIATHMFMQFCSFERLSLEGAQAELAHLTADGYLDARTAGLIRLHELDLFANSSLLREMLDAREIYRELRFHLRLPAADFTTDEDLKEKLGNETLYVQGVIDAVICHSDGTITLVDYKTDRLTREELADRSLAEAKLRARHGGQLQYYTAAIERIFGVPPRSVLLYSLPLGDTITL